MSNKKNDQFADIALTVSPLSNPELEVPSPPDLVETILPLEDSARAEFTPLKKISTPDELRGELDRWKARYSSFLLDLAPQPESTRYCQDLSEFDWRIEDEEDRSDFNRVLSGGGAWDKVVLPHYGGPLGKAVTYYRSSFILEDDPREGESCYICFKGADYRAHIFINGAYVGSHEGFFAPFEFDISTQVHQGENVLTVKLENDYIFGGNVNAGSHGERYEGDKIYAATGPGYDDPEMGWHHCPPGMGLYQEVFLELRPSVHVHDLFIRPLPDEQMAEAWVEVTSTAVEPREVKLLLSLYGQNFEEVLFQDREYIPCTGREVGLGDSFTEQKLRAEGLLDKPIKLMMEKGVNLVKIPLSIKNPRIWEPESPWLYQFQVKLLDVDENLLDTGTRQFGMRSFSLDVESTPKGMFKLNGKAIRLRGANTMGHEQQCVMKKDWNQLVEDLLLARICNMNFLRLTQRPVQSEVYDFCDRLGLMTQTDLPLFGVLKRDRFCEVLRQTEEMERLVRSHPCNIVNSYINEPFPNAGNKPHRHLTRMELEQFFKCADAVVHLNNPDRVIKHVDGDYDPPSETLPDNHCYTHWYNGHGLDAGALHRGSWMPVRRGWNYGCGEFGVEGLESLELMKRRYPSKWLPVTGDDESLWSPDQIIGAQTGNFHYQFFPTPRTLEQWVARSQRWQAQGVTMMTEAFRRDNRMVTFAIHLFIDAFPAGWMKTIMDCERNPKPAYFAYREALTPLMVNLRTDRFRCYGGESAGMELWICNDTGEIPEDARLVYLVKQSDRVLASGEVKASIECCASTFQGFIRQDLPEVKKVEKVLFLAALIDSTGKVLHDTAAEMSIFPRPDNNITLRTWSDGSPGAGELTDALNLECSETCAGSELIILGAWEDQSRETSEYLSLVEKGATLLLLNLPEGSYSIGGEQVEVKQCGMMPIHFAAVAEDYILPEGVDDEDFRFWYNSSLDRIAPISETTFMAPGFNPILLSGNTNNEGEWGTALVAAELQYGKGHIALSQVLPGHLLEDNPPARLLIDRLLLSGRQEDY